VWRTWKGDGGGCLSSSSSQSTCVFALADTLVSSWASLFNAIERANSRAETSLFAFWTYGPAEETVGKEAADADPKGIGI